MQYIYLICINHKDKKIITLFVNNVVSCPKMEPSRDIFYNLYKHILKELDNNIPYLLYVNAP